MARIAHISDLHIPCAGDWPWRNMIFNKRLTGAANLLTFRNDAPPFEVCEELVEDLRSQDIDHVILTGDLTNLSLEEEFERAHSLLSTIGDASKLSLIPGNHDKYVEQSVEDERFEFWFGPWMHGEGSEDHSYPYAKSIAEGVRLMGLCSAIPTPPFMSWGRLGEAQLTRLVGTARDTAAPGEFTIAALHHNLHPRGSARKDWSTMLKDREAFKDALFEARINLVVHGHTHEAHRMRLERGDHHVSVVGCGSSSWTQAEHPARYNIYTIEAGALEAIHCRIRRTEAGGFEPQSEPLTFAD